MTFRKLDFFVHRLQRSNRTSLLSEDFPCNASSINWITRSARLATVQFDQR
jgi:hypothetical protein